jgi:hypothetical protein
MLAALLEKDLLGGLLWTDQVKGVGAGPIAEIVEYEEFNSAELSAYRGVLDDIAKETGGRATKVVGEGANGEVVIRITRDNTAED